MQLSEPTIKILSNFASFNPSILLKPGNVVSTIGTSKNFFGIATVEETFSVEAGIGDLNKFLGIVTLLKTPELTFSENQVLIVSGNKRVNYTYAHPSTILTAKSKVKLPSTEVSFVLEKDVLSNLFKVSKVLGLADVCISGKDGKLMISAVDCENPTADSYDVELGETTKTFDFFFKREYLQLLDLDYDVEISEKMISSFKSGNIEYNIALERNSTYTG